MLLAYMSNLAEKYQPSTLWSQHSMMKALIKHIEDIGIEFFVKLKYFIKAKNKNYVKKKSNTFTAKEIEKFLLEALDHNYLATKVHRSNCSGSQCPKSTYRQFSCSNLFRKFVRYGHRGSCQCRGKVQNLSSISGLRVTS